MTHTIVTYEDLLDQQDAALEARRLAEEQETVSTIVIAVVETAKEPA